MGDRSPWLNTPLDPLRPWIRILKLHKGAGDDPIVCTLHYASLAEDPHYESLSYVWGDATKTRKIIVDGEDFQATINLFDFLLHLRQSDDDRLIWADAICIDQLNEEEKRSQIQMMTKIYRQAKVSHIWFGPFTDQWVADISNDLKRFCPSEKLPPSEWNYVERTSEKHLHWFKNREGFKPLKKLELRQFEKRCEDDIFSLTLEILKEAVKPDGGAHLFTYPVYCRNRSSNGETEYTLNKSWIKVIDCMHWLLSRPWWSRVWTLQEAVLPAVDPVVHAPPYSFNLSTVLDGTHSMSSHGYSHCCKYFSHMTLAEWRHSVERPFNQSRSVFEHRKEFATNEGGGVALYGVVQCIQGRQATDVRDFFYGAFGLLPTVWQDTERQSAETEKDCSAGQIFAKTSKLLYTNDSCLSSLALARGQQRTAISDLPSWAIDLSVELPKSRDTRWPLYNATLQTKFEGYDGKLWKNLKAPDLEVQAIRIGTVGVCGGSNPSVSDDVPRTRKLVGEWHKLFLETVPSATSDDSAFWRGVFMDRDVQRHWMHKRTEPLYARRIPMIRSWWRNWNKTGDYRDLTVDRNAGGAVKGSYHHMALSLNVRKASFFITAKGEAGMGPHDIKESDELYVFSGCRAPVAVRKIKGEEGERLTLVGLCFVDGWMYGKAVAGYKPTWETLTLY